ncbi:MULTISPECIES: ribonuclease HII [unclassified Haloarcula]|uniref:ribonuclease HII n=1 Tax=unclassified Haloarcula TaxID=2624677 RepID=UPI0007BBE6E2|nr:MULTISPECIES: ribonuclease HII [unclassified Haloarcula]KZX49485.1 ribonuclease HII [Haloarcula sp. K1]MUV49607.1 ribonuclease HII [Haloarcula sp. CBA1122]
MRFGVDEAGKGPVLGSMFAAAVRADPAALPDGVGDSKDIRPERRERLAGDIRESADAVGIAEIPVGRIDADGTDMNTLTVDGQAEALSAVARDGLSGTVDAGDTDAARFGRRVADAVDTDVAVTAEHGADETDSLVGAASIIAKVARDTHVADLAEEYGDVGSGYPSDPTTRAFLADYVDRHSELPACARRSWSTCDDVLAAAEQASLGDF